MLKEYIGNQKLSEKSRPQPPVIESRKVSGNSRTFDLVGAHVAPGTRLKVDYSFSSKFENSTLFLVNGQHPGPVVCLTAAIHGDELNGVDIIRQVMDGLDALTLKGVVIGIPIVNLEGYNAGGRYMDDTCDLNRCFPGNIDSSYPKQFAHNFFKEIILHCDALIDLHTGSTRRENHPQLRADLSIAQVAALSEGFGTLPVVQDVAPKGSLREAATQAGVPALVMEVGSSRGLEPEKIGAGVQGIRDLLQGAGMTLEDHFISNDQQVYLGSGWVHSEFSGILINNVELGQFVLEGDMLAEVVEPLTNEIHKVFAPFACTILGRAHNQHVAQGFSLFRVGIKQLVS